MFHDCFVCKYYWAIKYVKTSNFLELVVNPHFAIFTISKSNGTKWRPPCVKQQKHRQILHSALNSRYIFFCHAFNLFDIVYSISSFMQ